MTYVCAFVLLSSESIETYSRGTSIADFEVVWDEHEVKHKTELEPFISSSYTGFFSVKVFPRGFIFDPFRWSFNGL